MSSPFTHDASYSDANSDFGNYDGVDNDNPDVQRRVMRVKVLYTFDNDNKTHCLARLVRPVPIQVVALDETEIGVVELRTCIQAIVAASPEMIAKLENDYTVYAYDYSEYETPLVGQGALSWVLATASPTPNAPARESGTMVTGRVCRNIMGLFASGGIKETLEVKLKLVPVPTRSKREFLQSMAVYRDPNVMMPEGFDSNAWNSFLQAIPDAGVLRDGSAGQGNGRTPHGGVEQLHDLLTPKFGPEDDMYSNGPGSSRAGSPTPSQRSMTNHGPAYQGSRPASRASFHQSQPSETALDDQGFEDGRDKKRARLMQTDWHGRGSFGANADSLRSAVTTAASIRNFRPASAIGGTSAGGDMIPRAPTPRPGEKRVGRLGMARGGSSLRRESTGGQSPYGGMQQHDLTRNDSGMYSADYDAGSSRHGSPSPDLPSSPPEYTPAAEAPSSPELPQLPHAPDSGFQSDAPTGPEPKVSNMRPPVNSHLARKARGVIEWAQIQPGPRENLPAHSFPNFDPLSHKSALSACKNRPGSPTVRPQQKKGGKAPSAAPRESSLLREPSITPAPTDGPSPNMDSAMPSIENSYPATPIENQEYNMLQPAFHATQVHAQHQFQQNGPPFQPQPRPNNGLQRTQSSFPAPPSRYDSGNQSPAYSGAALNNQDSQTQKPTGTNPPARRALKKSQSWAAAEPSSDIDSDGGLSQVAAAGRYRNGGSGSVRSASIYNQLQSAIATGAPVKYCVNCGEIKTPTWRPYWLKVFDGDGAEIPFGGATGTHMIEPYMTDDNNKTIRVRVYKQYGHLTPDERKDGSYQQANFCNPCGDYIRKNAKIRPREMWDPLLVEIGKGKKKPGKRKKKRGPDGVGLTSDAVAASSDWDHPTPFAGMPAFTDPFGPSEAGYDMSEMGNFIEMPRIVEEGSQQGQTSTYGQPLPPNDGNVLQEPFEAQADISALQKAIQSSPARILHPNPPMLQTTPNVATAAQPIAAEAVTEIHTPQPTRRLLFPSPRKDGEFKSLDMMPVSDSPANKSEGNSSQQISNSMNSTEVILPEQSALNNSSDPSRNNAQTTPTQANQNSQINQVSQLQTTPTMTTFENSLEVQGEVDKENLPPALQDDDDDFAHLFNDGIFDTTPGKKTPSKAVPRTPNSRTKLTFTTGLTPRTTGGTKRSAECMGPPDTPTPTKRRSPRSLEKTGERPKDMTPFSKLVDRYMSDGITSSPTKFINWAHTSSPGKNLSSTFDSLAAISHMTNNTLPSDDNLWSDVFPMPSSPPYFSQRERMEMEGDYGWGSLDASMPNFVDVDVYEDGTATAPLQLEMAGCFGPMLGGGAVAAAVAVSHVHAVDVSQSAEADVAVVLGNDG